MSTSQLNALAGASSAYLRSAMHQPIRWHEWGEEAFAEAQRKNKPVLLDIGAVWCHWCHVMDRESYDDPEVAQIVNERFLAIKVDRDERPDVDSRYQTAVSAISGTGGWPLTVFLTPEGKPFYGGTYFPPQDGYGRPSFKRVLLALSEAFQSKNKEVNEEADKLMAMLSHAEGFLGQTATFSSRIVSSMVQSALGLFDAKNGGFGGAPKFPHPASLDLLLDWFARTREEQVGNVLTTTLTRMAKGGVYDQVAGGFHRYSVDERWIVPHFEKMSYDNSELMKNYVHAYQVFGDDFYAVVAKDIIRWMDSWLSDRENGGFYGSQDADINLHDDGDHFTWTRDEAQSVLNEEEFAIASLHYDINEAGEMHHNEAKNVLWVRADIDEISARINKPVDEVRRLLESAKQKMYEERTRRPVPYIDKTVYVNWNGLCISAYLQAAVALGLEDTKRFALRSLDRILAEAWDEQHGLAHVVSYSEGGAQSRIPGMLDDYAFTVWACLDAYEASGDLTYFKFGRKIADSMISRFYDETAGGFSDTEKSLGEKIGLGALSIRRRPFQDAPTPAGNPAAVIGLLRLHAYTNESSYKDRAETTLEVFAGVSEQFGIYAGTYGIAATMMLRPHLQVVVIGEDQKADEMYREAARRFALNKSVVRVTHNEVDGGYLPPALHDTVPKLPGLHDSQSVAVVCAEFSCRPPITDAQSLRLALDELLHNRS